MSRPRDLVGGVGGAAAALTSSAYHAASSDPALHGHALQQKILEVRYRSCGRYGEVAKARVPKFVGRYSSEALKRDDWRLILCHRSTLCTWSMKA